MPGTKLFSVFAHDAPEELGGEEKLIGEMNVENDALKDDAYVLRRALLNTKVKQRALER